MKPTNYKISESKENGYNLLYKSNSPTQLLVISHQGGQWNTVLLNNPICQTRLLLIYVRWLYTAITRAKINYFFDRF
jgi:hypothetical protein